MKKLLSKRFSNFIAVAAVLLLLGAVPPARAQVFDQAGVGFLEFGPPLALGPAPPQNGFPVSFTDTPDGVARGISIGQCLSGGAGCLADPSFIPPAGPNLTNFPAEFFYFLAGPAGIVLPAPADITVIEYALEGGWGGVGTIVDGNQAVFQRIRYRLTGLLPGSTLTITHPWGTDTIPVDVGGEVNSTADVPGLVAGAFATAASATLIGPILTAVSPAPTPGFIGTCGGAQTVTGGALRNTLTVSGTNSAGTAFNVTTDRWDVCGELFAGGVREPNAHFHRDAAGAGRIDIRAIGVSATGVIDVVSADPANPLPGEDPVAVPAVVIPMNPVVGQPGNFIASIPLVAADIVPANVVITVDRAAPTQGISPNIPMTDLVTITGATFVGTSAAAGTLSVTATSSNGVAPLPVLTVTNAATGAAIGTMTPPAAPSTEYTFTTDTFATPTGNLDVMVTSAPAAGAVLPAGDIDQLAVAVTPFVPPPPPAPTPGAGGDPFTPTATAGGGGGGGGCFINSLF